MKTVQTDENAVYSSTPYGTRQAAHGFNKLEMAEKELEPRLASRLITDELLMDGTPALNLASFVTTYQEPEAEQLMLQNLSKNFIDVEEYPACGEIEHRCVNIVARMFNAPLDDGEEALGVSTVGSSEALILAVLAAKKRWQNRRKEQGKDYSKPNLIASAAVQVCVEKAARYLDIEERWIPVTEERFTLDPKMAVDAADENTIAIVVIHGTTYTGAYEDVVAVNDLLMEKNKKDGLDIHIHVDAASGGFVSPFVMPEHKFDFRVPLVGSINVSGHKYGLSYAGVGFVIFRNKQFLPKEVVFTVNYLGSDQLSFTLNFSKSAIQVIGIYYQFLRLGKQGYRSIMLNLTATAAYIAQQIGAMEQFKIISSTDGNGLPLVAWKLKDKKNYDEFAISHKLRQSGWIVPAYTMAPDATHMKLMRVVIREDFSQPRAADFLRDLKAAVKELENTPQAVLDHQQQQNKEKTKKGSAHAQRDTHPGDDSKHLDKTGKDNIPC